MTDLELIARLFALLEGVEGSMTCLCGRRLRVGLSTELWQTVLLLRARLDVPVVTATPEESSRLALVEVD